MASQRRASSEGLGLLARLGNDLFAARLVSFMHFHRGISLDYFCYFCTTIDLKIILELCYLDSDAGVGSWCVSRCRTLIF